MAYQIESIIGAEVGGVTSERLESAVREHREREVPRLAMLWNYYRNPMERAGAGGRGYRLAQERGLPARLTSGSDERAARREVVIENDIGWRIGAMVDFLFGQGIKVHSSAADAELAQRIERALERVWEDSGGQGFLQDVALMGHVYGYVDLLVRQLPDASVRIELIEPSRGVALVSAHDYRVTDAYALIGAEGTTEVLTAQGHQVYQDSGDGPELIAQEPGAGMLPVAHIQNLSQPLAYAGLSEVEALIPLQDELNTRLSDRAARVTMQSFKMYLAKGIEGFDKSAIGPGQYWTTENTSAEIQAFGGDGDSPSEESHINEVREALDKISAVPPLATGVVKAKVGNLTSESALRLTLAGLLARTARKRITYGRGIIEASRIALAMLAQRGVLETSEEQRGLSIEWADPLAGIAQLRSA